MIKAACVCLRSLQEARSFFDNLLNNIYKYAQQGISVYLNMEYTDEIFLKSHSLSGNRC